MVSKTQKKRIADFLYGKVDDGLVSPPSFYVALITGAVSADGVITGEISGGGYERVKVTNSKDSFTVANDDAVVYNKIDVTFNESTTTWGDITYVAFMADSTTNVAHYYVPISPAKKVQAFTTVYFKGSLSDKTGAIELSVEN